MKLIRKHLEKLKLVKRKKYHPLIHKIHKKHNISKKTLFYVKEYGPNTNVPRTIIKESIKILILASLISSFGGLAFEHIKLLLVSLTPLIILFPALNDMVGDFGTIISSKFSSMLHEGKLNSKDLFKNKDIRRLFIQIFIIAIFFGVLSSSLSFIFSSFSDHYSSLSTTVKIEIAFKVLIITLIDIMILIPLIFSLSIYAGLYFYRRGEDPNNFLIPITTSFADFGNMIILYLLIILFF